MKKMNKKGFTIVELVIVIAVIAILAAVLIPTFASLVSKADESKAYQEATNLYKDLLIEKNADFDPNTTTDGVDCYIVSGEYVYEVVNGNIKLSEVKANAIPTGYTALTGDFTNVYAYSAN